MMSELGLTKQEIMTLVNDGFLFTNKNKSSQVFIHVKEG